MEEEKRQVQNNKEADGKSLSDISLQKLDHNWFTGFYGEYQFHAKVYDVGSKFGISGGRVSKLNIYCLDETRGNSQKILIANYDRGWDVYPKTKTHREMLRKILNRLQQLPPSNSRQYMSGTST